MIKIYGHQRSGNHYIAALVDLNFTHLGNYIPLIGNHKVLSVLDRHVKYIYIFRRREAVLKSVFNMRGRFGLMVDNYDDFCNTPYSVMYSPKTDPRAVKWTTGSKAGDEYLNRIETGRVSGFFKNVPFIPAVWHDHHVRAWERLVKLNDNLHMIKYDNLKSGPAQFQKTMSDLNMFLFGYNKKIYKDISHRVGWYVETAGQKKEDKFNV